MVKEIEIDVGVSEVPKNGCQAYDMLVTSLITEIADKEKLLTELLDNDVRCQFIRLWHSGVTRVNIHV